MCIFCKIIAGEIPCAKVYENEHALVFLDRNQDVLGHTLVVPKIHFENVMDVPDELLAEVLAAARHVAAHYIRTGFCTGFNFITNCGEDAGQTVFHLHFHIFPRHKSDGVPAWALAPNYDEDLQALAEKLRLNA